MFGSYNVTLLGILFFLYSVYCLIIILKKSTIGKKALYLNTFDDCFFKYIISIKTENDEDAKSDRGVRVVLNGSYGSSQPFFINSKAVKAQTRKRAFELKSPCYFLICSKDNLGDLDSFDLEIVSFGRTDRWDISEVVVIDIQTQRTYFASDALSFDIAQDKCIRSRIRLVKGSVAEVWMKNILRTYHEFHLWISPMCSDFISTHKLIISSVLCVFFMLSTTVFASVITSLSFSSTFGIKFKNDDDKIQLFQTLSVVSIVTISLTFLQLLLKWSERKNNNYIKNFDMILVITKYKLPSTNFTSNSKPPRSFHWIKNFTKKIKRKPIKGMDVNEKSPMLENNIKAIKGYQRSQNEHGYKMDQYLSINKMGGDNKLNDMTDVLIGQMETSKQMGDVGDKNDLFNRVSSHIQKEEIDITASDSKTKLITSTNQSDSVQKLSKTTQKPSETSQNHMETFNKPSDILHKNSDYIQNTISMAPSFYNKPPKTALDLKEPYKLQTKPKTKTQVSDVFPLRGQFLKPSLTDFPNESTKPCYNTYKKLMHLGVPDDIPNGKNNRFFISKVDFYRKKNYKYDLSNLSNNNINLNNNKNNINNNNSYNNNNNNNNQTVSNSSCTSSIETQSLQDIESDTSYTIVDNHNDVNELVLNEGLINLSSDNADLVFTIEKEVEWMVAEIKVLCLSKKDFQTNEMETFESLSNDMKDKLDDIKNKFYLRLKRYLIKNNTDDFENKDHIINQHMSEEIFAQTLLENSYHQALEYVKKIAEKSYKNPLKPQPICINFLSCDELIFEKRLENIDQNFLDSIALKSFKIILGDIKPKYIKSFNTLCYEDFQILVVNAVDKVAEEVFEQLMKENIQSDFEENAPQNNDKRLSEFKPSTISALNLHCLNFFIDNFNIISKRINSFHTIYLNFSLTHNFINNALLQTKAYMNKSFINHKLAHRNLFNSFQKPIKPSSSFLEVFIASEIGSSLYEIINSDFASILSKNSESSENSIEDPISKISVLMHLFPLDIAYLKYKDKPRNTWSESYPFSSLDKDVLWVKFTCKLLMIYLACFNIPAKYADDDDDDTKGGNNNINLDEKVERTSSENHDVVCENFYEFDSQCWRKNHIKEFNKNDELHKNNTLESGIYKKSFDNEKKNQEDDADPSSFVAKLTYENCSESNDFLALKLKSLKILIESHKRNKMANIIDDYTGSFNDHNTDNGDPTSVQIKNFLVNDINNSTKNIPQKNENMKQNKDLYLKSFIKAPLKPNKADKTSFKKLYKLFLKESEDFLKSMVTYRICEHHMKLRDALWKAFWKEAHREEKEIENSLQSNLEHLPQHTSHAFLNKSFVSNKDSSEEMAFLKDTVINMQNKIITKSVAKVAWNLVEMCCDEDFQRQEVAEFRREVIKLADELNQKILTSCQFYLANKINNVTHASCGENVSNNNNENNVSDESSRYSFENDERISQKSDDSEINVNDVMVSDDSKEYFGIYSCEVNKANNNSMASTASSRAKIVSSKKSTIFPKPSRRSKTTSSASRTFRKPMVSTSKMKNKSDGKSNKPSVQNISKLIKLSSMDESLQKDDGTEDFDSHDLKIRNEIFMKNWEDTEKIKTIENLVDELVDEENYDKLMSLACNKSDLSSKKNVSYDYNLEKIENLISDEIENKSPLPKADSDELFVTNSLASVKIPTKNVSVRPRKREALSLKANHRKMSFPSDSVGRNNSSKSPVDRDFAKLNKETTEEKVDNFYRIMNRKHTNDKKNYETYNRFDEEKDINSEYQNLENKKSGIKKLVKPSGDQKVSGIRTVKENLKEIIPRIGDKKFKKEEAQLMKKLKKIYENDESVKLCDKWAFELTNKMEMLALKNIETHKKDDLEFDFIDSEERNIYIARKRKNLFDSQNYLHLLKSFKATEKRLKKLKDWNSENDSFEETTSNEDFSASEKVDKSGNLQSGKNHENTNEKSKRESCKDKLLRSPLKTSSCDGVSDSFEVDGTSRKLSPRNEDYENDTQGVKNEKMLNSTVDKSKSEKTKFSSETDFSKISNFDNTESFSNGEKSLRNLSSSKENKEKNSEISEILKTESLSEKNKNSKFSKQSDKHSEENVSSKHAESRLSKNDTSSFQDDEVRSQDDKSISSENSKSQSIESITKNELSSKRSHTPYNGTDKKSSNSSIELENSFKKESLKTATMKRDHKIESSAKCSKSHSGSESMSPIPKNNEKTQSTSHSKSFSTIETNKQSFCKEKSSKSIKSIDGMGVENSINKKSEHLSLKKDISTSLSKMKRLNKNLVSLTKKNCETLYMENRDATGDTLSNKRFDEQSANKTLQEENSYLYHTRSNHFPSRQEVVQTSLQQEDSQFDDDEEIGIYKKTSKVSSGRSVLADDESSSSSDRSILSEMQNNRKILNLSSDWNPVLTSITFFLVFLLCCLIFIYSMMLFRSLDGNSAVRCLKSIFYSLLIHFFLIEPAKVFIIATFFSVFSRKIIF